MASILECAYKSKSHPLLGMIQGTFGWYS